MHVWGKPWQSDTETDRIQWIFDTRTNQWSFLDPRGDSSYPSGRVYHASASTSHPMNSVNDQTEDPMGTAGSGFDDHGTIFIHGGFSSAGAQADVWGFDVASRTWAQHPDAPGPARGGTGLTFAQDRLYRFGGCDGTQELGGSLDVLHFAVSTFDDKGGKGELAVAPKTGEWASIEAAGDQIPGNRSVAGFGKKVFFVSCSQEG